MLPTCFPSTPYPIPLHIIFMRFCSCFKLSKKIEKLSNEQPVNAITKCTLAGLVQEAKNLIRSEIWSCACVFSTTLLLPSTATHAGWKSKCRCYQRKNKRPQPAWGKLTNSGLRFTPQRVDSYVIQRTRHGIHLTLAQFVQQLSHPKDQTWNSSHIGSVCSTAVSSKGPGMEFISHWLSLFNNCLIQRTRLNSSPVSFLSSRRPGF